MKLLACNKVKLAYEGNTVLSDLSFEVQSNDYLCIVGENGSGKSTLMKALLGLKSISDGEIDFLNGLTRNEIGYLPQQNGIQKDFPATVYEVVISGRAARGGKFFYSRNDKRFAKDAMEKMDVADLSNKSFKELSGGQQQRVLLARALCATSRLIILDEPISGLDPRSSSELYNLIAKIHKEGVAIIMVTHDIKSAIENATQILHIGKKPIFFGEVAQYKKFIENYNGVN